jgi:hypothetical protein
MLMVTLSASFGERVDFVRIYEKYFRHDEVYIVRTTTTSRDIQQYGRSTFISRSTLLNTDRMTRGMCLDLLPCINNYCSEDGEAYYPIIFHADDVKWIRE